MQTSDLPNGQQIRELFGLKPGEQERRFKSALEAEATRITQEKVGRNDPCPCGSGKKFKKCCLGQEWKREMVTCSLCGEKVTAEALGQHTETMHRR